MNVLFDHKDPSTPCNSWSRCRLHQALQWSWLGYVGTPWNWCLDVHIVCEICWTGGATLSCCVFKAPGLPFIDPHFSLPLRPERMTFDVLGNHKSVQKQRSFRRCGHEGSGLDRHASVVSV